MLTLSKALKTGRVGDFIRQQEEAGIGPIDKGAFNAVAETIIKAPRSKDQTSRSSSGGGSTGKKTRRGTGQGVSG
jgi:hypothetical protein